MDVSFEYVDCPVCNQTNHRKLYKINYFNVDILPKIGITHTPESIYLCYCLHCGHRYANPQLSDNALDLYYTKINTEYYQPSARPTDQLLLQHKYIIQQVEKHKNGGNVLEIGCGNGFLLSLFDKNRWRVTGVEPFGPAASFAKDHLSLNVINNYLDESTFDVSEKFDVILLFDVMEHLKDPNGMINLINFYLKPDGLLIIGTGNINSLNARLSGSKWFYISLYEHLSFFTRESIKYLLRNFIIIDINNVSYSGNVIDNTLYFINNHLIRRAYNLTQALHYNFTKFKLTKYKYARYISSFDHMIVIVRKNL